MNPTASFSTGFMLSASRTTAGAGCGISMLARGSVAAAGYATAVSLTMREAYTIIMTRYVVSTPVVCAGILIAGVMLREWWSIAIQADLAVIEQYHFGSESMMQHGGWWYSNPELYAWLAFGEGILLLGMSVAVWFAVVRRSRAALAVVVLLAVVGFGSRALLGGLGWEQRSGLSSTNTIFPRS